MSIDLGHIGQSMNDFAKPAAQRTTGSDLGQEDFLKIMMEQLRSQNPMEPQDNSEFFSQIVQFQSLDAMQGMAKAIQQLTEVSELSQASALVGRDVAAVIEGRLDPDTGMPNMPEEVEGTVAKVTFADGQATVHLEDGRQVPMSKVVAVS